MRYALFSDVHAYPQALEKALADAAGQNVDFRICLGDVVGYGPDPVGAIDLCRERCEKVLSGNHDAAVVRQISTMFFIPFAKKAVSRHQGQLDELHMDWLAELPMSFINEDFAAAHGEFHLRAGHPEAGFGYILSEWDAERTLDALPPEIKLVFVGHTHAACVWRKGHSFARLLPDKDFTLEPDFRYVVNVGSVGYPRNQYETNYVIYDTEERSVTFRHIPFDFDDYVARLERSGSGQPLWLTSYLADKHE